MMNRITRRDAIKYSLMGAAGMALWRPFGNLASAAVSAGKAKAVIQIWMWGGPSHLDTFDPKPEAGGDYCGPYTKPIETNVGGIRISEALPMLAKQADKYSIIRSMTHRINGHETASYTVQTGRSSDERLSYPCIGALVSLFKGYDFGYTGNVPPYVVLTTPQGRFSESGFLGSKHKPFSTGGDPNREPFAVEGIVVEGISSERQAKRRALLHDLDSLGKAMPNSPELIEMDRCEEGADQIAAETGKVFDLSTEEEALRERYGRNTFGQSCLAARKLVENGVPYVTINYNGWDTHKQHFQAMQRKLPELDRGMSALLEDLEQRGLLDSTIVWWSGEFGRSPKILWESPWNGGRSHYGNCFSAVLAGGGFKGGLVVGASDVKGEEPSERPVYPRDVLGSMLELLGIDPDGPMPNPKGLEVKVMASTDPEKGRGRLYEIM